MSFYISFNNIKKAGVLFFLLTQTMSIYAESTDTIANITEVTADAVNQEQQDKNNFPRWPVRQQVVKELVPPPPPGPYMSLGLNDFPVSQPSFDSSLNKPEIELDSSGMPIQSFSPDVPWPKNLRPTKRWMPENGYQYVEPQAEKKPYPVVQSNNPAYNYNYGYQRNPNLDRPGPNWTPSMGAGPAWPYRYAPDYGSGYSYPVNNNRIQPGNYTNRAPYPAPGKP
jgi:hypothetical protein